MSLSPSCRARRAEEDLEAIGGERDVLVVDVVIDVRDRAPGPERGRGVGAGRDVQVVTCARVTDLVQPTHRPSREREREEHRSRERGALRDLQIMYLDFCKLEDVVAVGILPKVRRVDPNLVRIVREPP